MKKNEAHIISHVNKPEVRQVVVLIVELDFVIHPMVQQAQGILRIFERYYILFHKVFRQLCLPTLRLALMLSPN